MGEKCDNMQLRLYTLTLSAVSHSMNAPKYAELVAKDTTGDSITFSSVSGVKATQLLDDLQLTETDGFAEAPFETPAGH